MRITHLQTPALLVDAAALEHNLATMAAALPGARLRPHVKAHKCTTLARRQGELGHPGFTAATIREVEGMAAAGLGDDLLLANEVLDARRLGALVVTDDARVTVAVDSDGDHRRRGRRRRARGAVDVNVGLPRCGCRARRRRPASPIWPARRGLDGARRHGLRGPRGAASPTPRSAPKRAAKCDGQLLRRATRPSAATSSRPAAPAPTTSTRGPPRSRPAPTR